ncbi:uncharacterized protein BX664DRAFT_349896 [Halteromyces radiatus]|uniref:uncharacterized protein n=1 Tax=Halteromyces radiatus TaxID=101107 RepID=UPI00222020E0|nr:uncharacterized protein BX664DRAFT_349896 [Halteromyces radiatus]KAI8089507.1 hypothetical protein BX664DRAFT_349896 [Halteromyces radiatus]
MARLVLGNTEKIIFSSTSCSSTTLSTASFHLEQPLIHPYTSIRTQLISPSLYLYPLQDLTPQSTYEVRLSYPATVPTDFQLSLICNDTDIQGVLIQGHYAGVSREPGMENVPVPVDIVLEKLAFGIVYHGIYKIILMIGLVLTLGYFIILPRIKLFLLQPVKFD